MTQTNNQLQNETDIVKGRLGNYKEVHIDCYNNCPLCTNCPNGAKGLCELEGMEDFSISTRYEDISEEIIRKENCLNCKYYATCNRDKVELQITMGKHQEKFICYTEDGNRIYKCLFREQINK